MAGSADLRRSLVNLLRLVLPPVLILMPLLFPQSAVPGHAQLTWVLSCVARIGWLNRMTQFKDKAGKNRENASVGLYVSCPDGCRCIAVSGNPCAGR